MLGPVLSSQSLHICISRMQVGHGWPTAFSSQLQSFELSESSPSFAIGWDCAACSTMSFGGVAGVAHPYIQHITSASEQRKDAKCMLRKKMPNVHGTTSEDRHAHIRTPRACPGTRLVSVVSHTMNEGVVESDHLAFHPPSRLLGCSSDFTATLQVSTSGTWTLERQRCHSLDCKESDPTDIYTSPSGTSRAK